MIGYHYTTLDAYAKIQVEGLQLHRLDERHIANFLQREAKYLACVALEGCIWVYSKPMLNKQLVGLLVYVSTRHKNSAIVALEVDYEPDFSARMRVENGLTPDDGLLMQHTLDGVSIFNHYNADYDLITEAVAPSRIKLIGQWNLVEFADAGYLVGCVQ